MFTILSTSRHFVPYPFRIPSRFVPHESLTMTLAPNSDTNAPEIRKSNAIRKETSSTKRRVMKIEKVGVWNAWHLEQFAVRSEWYFRTVSCC